MKRIYPWASFATLLLSPTLAWAEVPSVKVAEQGSKKDQFSGSVETLKGDAPFTLEFTPSTVFDGAQKPESLTLTLSNSATVSWGCERLTAQPNIFECKPGNNNPPEALTAGYLESTLPGNSPPKTLRIDIGPDPEPKPDDATNKPDHLPSLQNEIQKVRFRLGWTVESGQYVTEHIVESRPLRTDRVVLFLDADLKPHFPIPSEIDERDNVTIAIVDQEAQVASLKGLTVKGCEEVPTTPRVWDGRAEAETTSDDGPRYAHRLLFVGRCSSDTPVEVEVEGDSSKEFKYRTNPVYALAIGVAYGFDGTTQRSLQLQTQPGNTVPSIVEEQSQIGLTPLLFLSWYPFGRDFEKRGLLGLYERFQIFVGLDASDFDAGLVVGGGFELLKGLDVLVGWRALQRVEVLNGGSGLALGDTFDGGRDALPTSREWKTGGVVIAFGLSSHLLGELGLSQ